MVDEAVRVTDQERIEMRSPLAREDALVAGTSAALVPRALPRDELPSARPAADQRRDSEGSTSSA
jgi:hypothetical protein